jgi:FtsH-binding integral membrane protein
MSGEREVRLRFILIFVMLYGCILFLIRPNPTTAQTVFRFALIVIGLAGLVWMQVRARRR